MGTHGVNLSKSQFNLRKIHSLLPGALTTNRREQSMTIRRQLLSLTQSISAVSKGALVSNQDRDGLERVAAKTCVSIHRTIAKTCLIGRPPKKYPESTCGSLMFN